jgi:MFS family permease
MSTDTMSTKSKGTTIALFSLALASAVQVVDPSVNNIAVVGAGDDLGMDGGQRAFAASVGTLALAASILAMGALGDRLGRKKVMLAGLATVIVGALVTSIAPSTAIYILGRGITGIGIAASFGLSFALLRSVSPDSIPKAVAFWLAVQTALAVPLSLIAGVLVGIDWRVGFLLNAVVAGLALALCLKFAPEAKADEVGPFDTVGMVAIAVALVGIIYGLSNAANSGWTSLAVLGPVAVGIVAFIIFAVWEARIEHPAFPIRLFADPELSGSVAVGFSFNMWQAVVMIQLSMLWQYVYQYTPLEVNLGQLPMTLAMIVGAVVAGRILARNLGADKILLTGHVLLIGTLVWLALAGTDTPYIFFLVPILVGGFARMLNETTMGGFFVSKPPPNLTGAMASSKTAIGQTSFALGTALSTTFLFGQFGSNLQQALLDAGVEPSQQGAVVGDLRQFASTGEISGDPARAQAIIDGASDVYLSSYSGTMWIFAGILTVLAVISTFFFAKAKRQKGAAATAGDMV